MASAGKVPADTLQGVVVTGTDTGVGKTTVSCSLLRVALAHGVPLVPFKPAESGCHPARPADALALRTASGRSALPLARICPFTFRAPVAPAAAAKTRLTLAGLTRPARWLARHGPLLIEGAGGVLSPYGRGLTIADVATDLGLPVLLIARNGLGTINHTALALAELSRRRIPVVGLILVTTRSEPALRAQKNAELIETMTGVRTDAVIPFYRDRAEARLDAALHSSGAAARILGGLGLVARHAPIRGA